MIPILKNTIFDINTHMTVFVSSDHHFFHRNIIKYANRPFDINDENCVVDNARMMVEKHNSLVKENDISIFVGDLALGIKGRDEMFANLLKSMNGKKILIRGNHDNLPDDFYINSAGFLEVTEFINTGNTFICHYPCYESKWNRGREPWLINQLRKTNCKNIIHGHIHAADPAEWESDGYNRMNVCVDFAPNDFFPIEIVDKEINEYIINKYEV